MAYDLIFRRHTPRNYSRDNPDPTVSARSTGLVGLGLLGAILLIPRLLRHQENRYYRRRLYDARADITQEMPAISMYELTGARRYPRSRTS